MRKIMLTGASGFVGARVLQKFPNAICAPKELVREPNGALSEFIKTHSPEVIINCAAISATQDCEENPSLSYLANVTLPVRLAEGAREVGAKLISFSSDQVYTGCAEAGPYREDAPLPTPKNVYARHKLEAENRSLCCNPSAVFLRATWMYDMPLFSHKNRGNFLLNVLRAIIMREKIYACENYFRSITYVRQVVDLLEKTFDLAGGVYNYGSENSLNSYETTVALFTALGAKELANELVVPTDKSKEEYKPHNLWIDCGKLRKNGIVFDSTAEGFARCLSDYLYFVKTK